MSRRLRPNRLGNDRLAPGRNVQLPTEILPSGIPAIISLDGFGRFSPAPVLRAELLPSVLPVFVYFWLF